MEYLDVLDEKGLITGRRKLRSEVHRGGDWHRAVHAWVINSRGELLLQKRSPIKDTSPNMWDISIAGHVPAGLDAITTVVQEAKEEMGLRLTPKDFEHLFTVTQEKRTESYHNREFNDVYLVHRDLHLSELTLQKDELTEVKFVPFRELEGLLTEKHPDYLNHPREFERLFTLLHERYNKKF